jgi:hypothetical protein
MNENGWRVSTKILGDRKKYATSASPRTALSEGLVELPRLLIQIPLSFVPLSSALDKPMF